MMRLRYYYIVAAVICLCGCTATSTRPNDFFRRAFRVVPAVAAVNSQEFEKILDRTTRSCLRPGHIVDVLGSGGETYPAMLRAIHAAQHTIDFTVYTFAPDCIGKKFAAAFAAAAARGVRVRVIYDRFGSPNTPREFFSPIVAAGGQVRVFNPYNGWTIIRMNNRSHRKILVVDGETAFMGSLNLSDLHDGDGVNSWRDLVLKVRGPSVRDVEKVFEQGWHQAGHGFLGRNLPLCGVTWLKHAIEYPFRKIFGRSAENKKTLNNNFTATACLDSGVKVRVVEQSPEWLDSHLLNLFETAISSAKQRIYICSPYFIPPPRLKRALLAAARRGLDVRILTQGKNDIRIMPLLAAPYFEKMTDGGIKIYAWTHSVIHSKYMVIDGVWSTVGSANFDSRSLILNYEANFAISDAALSKRLETIFLSDIANSVMYNKHHDTTRRASFWIRFLRHQF